MTETVEPKGVRLGSAQARNLSHQRISWGAEPFAQPKEWAVSIPTGLGGWSASAIVEAQRSATRLFSVDDDCFTIIEIPSRTPSRTAGYLDADTLIETSLKALLGQRIASQYSVLGALMDQAISSALDSFKERLEQVVSQRIAEVESQSLNEAREADSALLTALAAIRDRAAEITTVPLETAVGYLHTADLFDD